jgi:transcriptional regulator with XRE-family HTH domain
MSLAIHLVDALKASLKRRGRTYAEVAVALGVSEATVKRDLSKGTLGIDRFAQICEAIGVTLEELTEQIESRSALTEALTLEPLARVALRTESLVVRRDSRTLRHRETRAHEAFARA